MVSEKKNVTPINDFALQIFIILEDFNSCHPACNKNKNELVFFYSTIEESKWTTSLCHPQSIISTELKIFLQ